MGIDINVPQNLITGEYTNNIFNDIEDFFEMLFEILNKVLKVIIRVSSMKEMLLLIPYMLILIVIFNVLLSLDVFDED